MTLLKIDYDWWVQIEVSEKLPGIKGGGGAYYLKRKS